MSSPIPALKPVLIELLRESEGLIVISHDSNYRALVYGSRGVTQGLAPPYTVLRSLESIGDPMRTSSFGGRAMELLLTLDTWSSYAGPEEIQAMHDAIYETLNEQEDAINTLLTGFKCTYCLFDTNNELEDNSTSIRLFHGVERYRIRTEAV